MSERYVDCLLSEREHWLSRATLRERRDYEQAEGKLTDEFPDDERAVASFFYVVAMKRAQPPGFECIAPFVHIVRLLLRIAALEKAPPSVVYEAKPCDACRRRKRARKTYASEASPTKVYCVSDGRGRLKVGITTQVPGRIKTLRTAIPDLKVLAIVDGSKELEKAIHAQMNEMRIAGEWFVDTADARAALGRLLGIPESTLQAA